MMHDPEKSDSSIGATKPANNPGSPGAELVERRGEAEGNTLKPPTRRTQGRGSASPGLVSVYGKHRRQSPKVGAECPKWARSDLCGGRSVMSVPTAIPFSFFNRRAFRSSPPA